MDVDLYNNLPTLEHADSTFIHRAPLFAELGPLLSKYNNEFGVCLVHSHCFLSLEKE